MLDEKDWSTLTVDEKLEELRASQNRIRQGQIKQNRRNYGFYLCMIILVGLIVYSFTTTSSGNHKAIGGINQDTHRLNALTDRLNRDEYRTCEVQARGLPANHHLADSQRDISRLLRSTFQTTIRGQRKETSPYVLSLLRDLERQTNDYYNIEKKQPTSRSCTKPTSPK